MTTQKAIERSTSNTLPAQRPAEQPHAAERNRWYYSPHADIFETAEEFTIVLDMPGVSPENVEITCERSALIVRGRVHQQSDESRRPIRCEYGIGDYFRRFELGDTIDAERITAQPAPHAPGSGVIVVHLPKIERARPIKIAVTDK